MYSKELKKTIIERARGGSSIAQLARDYEPTEVTIHRWVRESEREPKVVSRERDLLAELRQANRKIRRLEETVAILGKATAWFSQNHQPDA